ncbi:MAG: helix-turn-helix transcriptional regulator [Leptospiraceae bacterium]|nr:helix-turn-helix transcriptional regulator [Leptospiraceae bacterium]
MPENSFLNFPVLFAFAIPHTIFTILFLMSKEERKLHDILASIWILLLAIPILQRFFLGKMEPSLFGIFVKSIVYPLCYGPMGYLYTKSLVEEYPIFSKKDFFHFIPILLFAIILSLLPTNLHPHNPPPPGSHPPLGKPGFLVTAFILDGFILISIFCYSFFILQKLRKHTNSVENYFSTITVARNLIWLKWTIWIFIFLFVWNSISPAVFKYVFHTLEVKWIYPHEFKLIHSSIFILFSYILSFFTLRQSVIYSNGNLEIPEIKQEQSKEEKYIRSGLKEDESQRIADKLIEYMEKEKPYLREDLRIREVADELGINLNYLSQALNEVIQKNFYQFVNEYRVKEIQERIKKPEFQDYPLLRIALECGFNSKSSFNSTFRRFTNISPKEYRKTIVSN